ncbi:hypothetical protein Aduo_013302 [Ancylostoma duodenale]
MTAQGGLRGTLNADVSLSRERSLPKRGAGTEELHAIPEQPVIWVYCMAHKIELALTDALATGGEDFIHATLSFLKGHVALVAVNDDAEQHQEDHYRGPKADPER